MSGCLRIDWAGALACALAVGALAVFATPGATQRVVEYSDIEIQDAAPFADRFLEAYRAGEEAALEDALARALAEREDPDAFILAHELFARHVRSSLGEPSDPGDFLDACALLAERAPAVNANEALPQHLATWRSLDRVALEREGRLLELFETYRNNLELAAAFLDALEAAHVDLSAHPPSLTAGLLLLHASYAARQLGRTEERSDLLAELDLVAQTLSWPTLRIRALNLTYITFRDAGDLGRATELIEASLAVSEEAELWTHAAPAVHGMGQLHRKMGWLERAEECYERAIELYEGQGHAYEANRVRSNLALIFRDRGELDRALETYVELQEFWRSQEARDLMAMGHGRIGHVLLVQGRNEEALAEFEAAQVLIEELEAPQAGSLNNIGCALRSLGRYPEAIDTFTLARERAEAESNAVVSASVLSGLGGVHFRLGQNARARELIERALEECEVIGHREGAAIARLNLGAILSNMGAYAEALHQLELARAEYQSLGQLLPLPQIDVNIGGVYARLDRPEEAVPLFERALEAFEAFGQARKSAVALNNLGLMAKDQPGQLEQALIYFHRAGEAANSAGARDLVAGSLSGMGHVLRSLGREGEAARCYSDAREIHLELGDRASAARCLWQTGLMLWKRGDREEAPRLLQQALAELESAGEGGPSASVLHEMAHVHFEAERSAEALRVARRAMELRMEQLQGLGEAESLEARGSVRCGADIGLAAVHALGTRGKAAPGPDLEEALWFVESGRALLLAEALVNREALLEANLPAELLEALGLARARVDDLNRRLSALRSARAPDAEQLAATRAELDGAHDELEHLVARVQREARRVADVVYPEPIELAALQDALEPLEALVLYQLCDANVFALVVRPDRSELFRLETTESVEAAVQRYVRLAGVAGSEERALASELHDALLSPLEGELADRARVLISPDGPLTFLPFEALLDRRGGEDQRALERWELAYVHSGTVLRGLREEAVRSEVGEGLLALGDPVCPGEAGESGDVPERPTLSTLMRGGDHLPRLRGSGAEVRAIAELFPEEQRAVYERERATLSALQEAAALHGGRFAAVHLACHGVLDAERPRLTGLVLAHGEALTADHLVRTRLPADLAVLSACDSGRGELLRGEGVLGLVRGFFFAGCPRVVVSNWKVDDESTRALMVSFYRHMRAGGLAPSAALRAAKLERLRSGGATAHPYHWASFVLWGLAD